MSGGGGIVLDDARAGRIGFDEAILCEQKTVPQIAEIASRSRDTVGRRLFTRLSAEKFAALPPDLCGAMIYDAQSRTAVLGATAPGAGPPRAHHAAAPLLGAAHTGTALRAFMSAI